MVPLGSALLENLIDLLKQFPRFDNIWDVYVSEFVQSSMWVAMVVLSGVRASMTPGQVHSKNGRFHFNAPLSLPRNVEGIEAK